MADQDKRDEAPKPDPAAAPRTVSVGGSPLTATPDAAATIVQPPAPSRFTPEEIGPGAPFDPTVRFRTTPVAGPPEATKNTKKVWVLYRGPSDNFLSGEQAFNRLDPVQIHETHLEWLRANQPAHSFEEIEAPA